jgi:hypothetical protein
MNSNPVDESRIQELNQEINRLNKAIAEYKIVIRDLVRIIKKNGK